MTSNPAYMTPDAVNLPAPPPVRIVVMASGNGSNFQALVDAVAAAQKFSEESGPESTIPYARIVSLFVNRKNAYAIKRAEAAFIPSHLFNLYSNGYLTKTPSPDPSAIQAARERYDADLANLVLEKSPHLVVLAGWMHIFSPSFLNPLAARGVKVINLHPGLPGQFDGPNAIERAHEAFQKGELAGGKTGIMVHRVVAQVDAGDPVSVREIVCKEGEGLNELAERIHGHEHELIVKATRRVVGEILEERDRE